MWFKPGQVDSDRFRVSSLKSRIKRKSKSDPNKTTASTNNISLSTESVNSLDTVDNIKLETPPTPPPRKCSKNQLLNDKDKEKILLTDRKFKNNRITKSSSKGKISDLEKRDSLKAATSRKTSAPPVLQGKPPISNGASMGLIDVAASLITTKPKSHFRSHSNLNLNALLKYKLLNSNNKKLTNDTGDIIKVRRKSLSETLQKQSSDEIFPSDSNRFSLDDAAVRNRGSGGGGDDEEQYHSCSEDTPPPPSTIEAVFVEPAVVLTVKKPQISLTSRVAAKFSDSKSKKSAKLKKRKGGRRTSINDATINNGNCNDLLPLSI